MYKQNTTVFVCKSRTYIQEEQKTNQPTEVVLLCVQLATETLLGVAGETALGT